MRCAGLLLVLPAAAATSWEAWKLEHGKTYAADEEPKRARIFEKNMAAAAIVQRDEPFAKFGATPFSDLTEEEFAVYHNGASFYAAANNSHLMKAESFSAEEVAAVEAASVDWRQKGAVTAVKDQKQCGSCWAFSTTGNIEGQWFLAGNKLVALSEEQLIACDKGNGDHGCMGGLPSTAYGYIKKAGGLETEADYPLTSTLPISFAKCKFEKSKAVATISSSISIASKESQMLAWLTKNGPISIGVNAAGSTWQTYKSGIVSNCKVSQPDHGVLIVGYGTEGSKPYWIVKNSWNTKWGEDGYIRLAYGSNQCNIQITPTSAVVTKN